MSKIRSYLPWGAKNVVRIVRLQGTIRPQSRGQGLNLQKIDKHLGKAFDIKKVKPKAVCLEINSPGGSAVQSSLIYQRIRNLSKATEVPVLSFTEDYAASGGYWLALAGDEIFVDPNSVVGSIGALFGNFGFEEAIKRLGKFKAFLNSEHSLFHLRYFENGPLEPGLGGVSGWGKYLFQWVLQWAIFLANCLLIFSCAVARKLYTSPRLVKPHLK